MQLTTELQKDKRKKDDLLKEVTRLTQELKESKITMEKMQTEEMMLWMEMRRVEKERDKLSTMLSESLVGEDGRG